MDFKKAVALFTTMGGLIAMLYGGLATLDGRYAMASDHNSLKKEVKIEKMKDNRRDLIRIKFQLMQARTSGGTNLELEKQLEEVKEELDNTNKKIIELEKDE